MADTNAINTFLADFDDYELKGGQRMPNLSDSLGTYTVELAEAVIKASSNPKKKGAPFFKATVKVLTAEGPNALPVGTMASIIITDTGFDYFKRDLKYLVGAALGEDPKTVKTDTITGFVSDDQPARGAKFMVMVNPPKKEGSIFNVVHFRALSN